MRRKRGRRGDHPGEDAGKSAAAGAVGMWALDEAIRAIWKREASGTLDQAFEARPDELHPSHVIAARSAKLTATSGKSWGYPRRAHARIRVGHPVLGAATHATVQAPDGVA